ncbi:MAG: hypothetical protein Tsb002_26130 [Wenzhouxiangellaceae bacterium]
MNEVHHQHTVNVDDSTYLVETSAGIQFTMGDWMHQEETTDSAGSETSTWPARA